MQYNFKDIEPKWQEYWLKNKTFKKMNDRFKPRYYSLDMFPYPSAAGLHVGHIEGYTASDIMARFKRMQGYNVLHPMGWDAFGLPAEQYALKTGNDPREFTYRNIDNFKHQIIRAGMSIDWDVEFATADRDYFKWTQWIFKLLYEKGLAELKEVEVNWCSELGTVLANDEIQIKNGIMVSERGGYPVVKKPMKQWVLKITEYAERLLNDLSLVDWPENLVEMQKNWIGRSEGAQVRFNVKDSKHYFDVFTTRVDTLYGATYCVLAPENPIVLDIVSEEEYESVKEYIAYSKAKTDLDRSELNKDKTGVFLGCYAINPVNGKEIPIWIADYVLGSYGTGAVMAVPAHDERDYDFATKYGLDIIPVIDCDLSKGAYVGDGFHINSGIADGLNIADAKERIISFLENNNMGERKVNYKLRDWVFSRQRYWGEPFPVIFWEDGTMSLVDDSELPLDLPVMKNMKPSGTGESPLANAHEWLTVIREDGVKGRRETNTMPQLAGSSWYFIGYILKSKAGFIPLDSEEAKEEIAKWLPVNLYIGGTEHAVGHLLYARFWNKVLYDCGIVSTEEPFQKLVNQGMILGSDNAKMSKSAGNVVNPDDIIKDFGADTLRLYEMFMGPLEAAKPWSTDNVEGAKRFIERVCRMYEFEIVDNVPELDKIYHQTVLKVTNDFEKLCFNTAISQMMIFVNEVYKVKKLSKEQALGFVKLLNPICPHITEEIYNEVLGGKGTIAYEEWPKYDVEKTLESDMNIVIQVNGKVRSKLTVSVNSDEEYIKNKALDDEFVKKNIEGLTVRKVIYVPKKLINIVAN